MFLHPVDYGRKAEELLWRKVYYEVIQVIKTNKKVNGPAAVGENPLCISAEQRLFEVTGMRQIFPQYQQLMPVLHRWSCTNIGPTVLALLKCSLIINQTTNKEYSCSRFLFVVIVLVSTVYFFLSLLQHIHSRSALECAYRTHLIAGVGFYQHLLLYIQSHYQLELQECIDWTHVTDPLIGEMCKMKV